MKDWKTICKKLLFPPLWLIFLMTIISAVALVYVFVKGWDTTPVAYVVYVFSFYTLIVVCILCWKTIPRYYKGVKGKVYGNKHANRYLTDAVFKTHVNLYRSLVINLLYVAVNAVSAILYSTAWFGIFATYYGIMAVMRFLLIRYVGHNEIGESRVGEWRRARLCAYLLMTVNLALSGAVLMMVYYGRGFSYQGVLIYVAALYTFYITSAAIRDMVKYRKYNSPVLTASTVIKLAAALMSMLFLETAMFAQFGNETDVKPQEIMIMATGAGISVVVITMSIYMIVRAKREIRWLKCGEKSEGTEREKAKARELKKK